MSSISNPATTMPSRVPDVSIKLGKRPALNAVDATVLQSVQEIEFCFQMPINSQSVKMKSANSSQGGSKPMISTWTGSKLEGGALISTQFTSRRGSDLLSRRKERQLRSAIARTTGASTTRMVHIIVYRRPFGWRRIGHALNNTEMRTSQSLCPRPVTSTIIPSQLKMPAAS